MRKVVRLKEKIFREYSTDIDVLKHNELVKEAQRLHIVGADRLDARSLAREIALVRYRKGG